MFEQDIHEDEDFEIPAFLEDKNLMIKLYINENSNNITGVKTLSSDAE